MAIISCPECEGKVSDKALSCPHCGFPIQQNISPPTTTRSRQPKRRKKLPNGFGCIKKLSGNRRNPYAAYPPVTEYHLNGTAKSVPAIGYFATYHAAYDALSNYRRNPYDINLANATFADVYEMWFDSYTNGAKKKSRSALTSYKCAFSYCEKLHKQKFKLLRKFELQEVIDNCPHGYSSLSNIKKLYSQMYKFALENDIAEKDYGKFVTINRENDNERGEPFSIDELKILWNNRDDSTVGMILLMCFTGFRISEFETNEKEGYRMVVNLEEMYLQGGIKTEAGKDRIVPFNEWLLPFVEQYATSQDEFKSWKFRNDFFYDKLHELGIEFTTNKKKHTPHDCRHTFSWICDQAKIDDLSKHMLMGHSRGNDVEKSVYGHRNLTDLKSEISKINIENMLLICH